MGITLGSNFTVNTALPLDDRMVVADIAARNAIPSGRRFDGMIVHCLSDHKNYQLQGGIADGNFVDISTVTPPVVNVPFVGSSLVNIYNKTLSDLASCKTTAGIRPSGLNSGIGSPLLTAAWTQTDVGTNQLTITKASGNAQGENIRFSIPVYQTNYGKVITVQFDFSVTANYVKPGSGTDGSLIMYLEYGDGVVNTYQQLSVVQIEAPTESNNLTARYRGEFQYIVDATKSYWLMFYCPRTETTTWTAYVRNLEIRPAQYVYGTPITDWQSYTPTFTGFGTPSSVASYWRRVGDSVQIKGYCVTGTMTAVEARLSLPNNIISDSSKLSSAAQIVGDSASGGSSSTYFRSNVLVEQNVNYVTFGARKSATDDLTKATGSNLVGNASAFSWEAQIPIQGWSSSVQTSDQTDTRVVAFSASSSNTTMSASSGAQLSLTSILDTHGGLTGGNSYVIRVPGFYELSGAVTVNSNTGSGSDRDLQILVNGSVVAQSLMTTPWFSFHSPNTIRELKAGDVVTWYFANGAIGITFGSKLFSLKRLSGPSAIAASETVSARYYVSAGASTTSSQPINYDTKDWDSHNAVLVGAGVWKFTAPISGVYQINNFNYFGATGSYNTVLFKNGATSNTILGISINNTTGIAGMAKIRLLAGDYIEARPNATVTPTSQGTLSGANYIEILRVGNY